MGFDDRMLIKFGESEPILDGKNCWYVDMTKSFTNECIFAFVNADLSLFEKSVLANTIPLGAPVFAGYWMNQFFPSHLPLDEIDIYFFGLRMAQNLRQYSVENWRILADANTLSSDSKPTMFIAILSRSLSKERREMIRNTWLSDLPKKFEFRFFLGNDIHTFESDVVYLEVEDSYDNLSLKMDLVFDWVKARSSGYDFFARFDDDVFVDMNELVTKVSTLGPHTWWGSFTHTAAPVRDESVVKEYLSLAEWPDCFYPLFARGFAYVISMDLVLMISTEKRQVPFDDVQLGIRVMQLVEQGGEVIIRDEDEERIAMNSNCNENEWSKIQNNTMIVHHVNSEQIYCMYTQQDLCLCTYMFEFFNYSMHIFSKLASICRTFL